MSNRDTLLALVVVIVGAFWVSGDRPDADERLDVAVVGDSFAEQSRDQFLAMAEHDELTTEYFAFGGTALCGWANELRALAEREPDHLVLSFAGNDLVPCMNPTGQTRDPETVAADYRRDLERTIELFRPTGAQIYVVMPPPVREPLFESHAAAMREMYRDTSAVHPVLTVIDTAPVLGPDGAFHPSLPCVGDEPCGPDGTVVLRTDDGIHLTPPGGRRYAQAMIEAIEDRS